MKKKSKMLLFLLPSLCGLLIFYCIPFILSIYYTLIENMSTKKFVGFDNFIDTLKNPMFQRGLTNTGLFMSIGIPLCIVLAFFLALSFKRMDKGKGIVGLILLLPLVIPSGTTVYFWKSIFDINGLLNKLLYTFDIPIINWYNSKGVMLIAVTIFSWKNIGLITMLFYVGLKRIPREYYEVANIEGANTFKQFRHVTLIYLLPTIFIAIILSITNSFKIFKEIYMLFGNYPNEKIYLLQHYMNNQFFSLNMQKLTTASYILFIIIGIIIYLLFSLQKRFSDTFNTIQFENVHNNIKGKTPIKGGIVIITAFLIVIPLLFIFSNSFMGSSEIINRYTTDITNYNMKDLSRGSMHFVRMGLLPDEATISQYKELLFRSPEYLRLFWNSIFIVIPVLIGQCIISPLGAYAFEQSKWKYKEVLFFVYILIMLMPLQVLLVPNYLVSKWLGFIDTYWAIILPGIFNPLGVFIVRLQLKGFPKECIEAAQNAGANHWQTFRHIVLPNLKSSIAILGIITFAEYWNVVDQAIVFIKGQYNKPLSVHLSHIAQGDLGMFFAISCFYMIPVLIIFFAGKDYLSNEVDLMKSK